MKTLLVSLAGIRFDRGMGEYIKLFLPYLINEFKSNLILISNTNIPDSILKLVNDNDIKFLKFQLSYPILEQVFVPLIIKTNRVKIAYFPANTFPLIKAKDVKYIVTIHDLIFLRKDINPSRLYQKIGKFYRAFIIKNGIKNIDTIVASSYKTLMDIKTIFNISLDDSNVIYNPFYFEINGRNKKIDNSILSLLHLEPGNYLYTISGTSDNKNLEFVLRAFAKLRLVYPYLKLVISGIFKIRDVLQYKPILDSLYIKDSVVFTPYITEEQKRALIRNCKAFLYLSKDEGFGRPIIEALIENAVVIASDIPIFREIGDKYIFYVSIDNDNCLVDFFQNLHPKNFNSEEVINYLKSKFDVNVLAMKLIQKIYITMKS
jgi:glycosyltransferase involved in cell wall biosynthesis